jgi:hypothetical protein
MFHMLRWGGFFVKSKPYKEIEVIKELNGYYRTKNIKNKGPNDGSYVHERKNSGFVLLLWTWLHLPSNFKIRLAAQAQEPV